MNCHICQHPYESEKEDFLVCPKCGHGFRIFDKDPINYHRNEYRLHFRRNQQEFDYQGNPNRLFHRSRKKIVAKRIKLVKPYINTRDVCLDIGAGGGTFAKAISRRIDLIDCVEVAPKLVEECKRFGFKTYEEDFLQVNFEQKYDIVFAWHVLEHVIEVQAFIDRVLAMTRKYFLLEIPFKRRIPELFDGHFHYFSMTSFRLLLGEKRIIQVTEGVQKPAIFAAVRGEGDE